MFFYSCAAASPLPQDSAPESVIESVSESVPNESPAMSSIEVPEPTCHTQGFMSAVLNAAQQAIAQSIAAARMCLCVQKRVFLCVNVYVAGGCMLCLRWERWMGWRGLMSNVCDNIQGFST